MNIKIEITSYDKDNKQTLGLDLTIYHRNPAKAKELAKALLDAVEIED